MVMVEGVQLLAITIKTNPSFNIYFYARQALLHNINFSVQHSGRARKTTFLPILVYVSCTLSRKSMSNMNHIYTFSVSSLLIRYLI